MMRWLRALSVLMFAASAAAHAAEHVLIIGGAGASGSAVTKLLLARGDKVTAFVRPATDRSSLAGLPVDYVVGDAMIADEVDAALAGKQFTVFFDTIQILSVTEQQSYSRLYGNFMPWAKRMGIKQFLSLGGACNGRAVEDCPLSPPLYAVAKNTTIAENILVESGVPYTVFRIGALVPGGPNEPDADLRTGTSFLTEDRSVFGIIWRGDLYDQVAGCIGAERCINKIFSLDDPVLRPQLDAWLCKRSHETDTIIFEHPDCGDSDVWPQGMKRR